MVSKRRIVTFDRIPNEFRSIQDERVLLLRDNRGERKEIKEKYYTRKNGVNVYTVVYANCQYNNESIVCRKNIYIYISLALQNIMDKGNVCNIIREYNRWRTGIG